MHSRRLLITGLVLGLLSLPFRLTATTVEPPSVDTLINQSDYVVRAVVKSATPEWREHNGRRFISTRVELEVRQPIKGAPPATLVIDLPGGRIGEDELRISGMPALQAGDEQVLFVIGAERKMFPIASMMHGLYPIVRDPKSSQEYVLRSNGRPLYQLDDVSLPMDRPSPTLQQNAAARPLTAGTFIQQLRTCVQIMETRAREN